MVAQNLNPNPSCASGITHWDKDDSAGVTVTWLSSGLASPFPRTTGIKWVIPNGGNAQTSRANITAGNPVSAGIWIVANKSVAITLFLDSYIGQDVDSSGSNYIGEAASDSATVTTTPTWFPLAGGTVPAGASWVGITVLAGAAATFQVTGCRFVQDTTINAYFDGASPSWVWDGTAGASTSRSTATSSTTGNFFLLS